ncbi:MAG: tail fiber domain-containing protein [Ignavibacteria bacterium]|nr:tail fiber domain-containing protein [Ignavibacteria bacterium]
MKTKLFILLLMAIFGSSTYSQSITNTLGSTGNFIIKDVSNTFFTLDQATGFVTLNNSMSLPNTTSSTIGVIYKGSTRFIHNYYGTGTPGGNTFVGAAAGNFTMSGSGDATSYNSGFGASSLQSNTTGQKNSAFGVQTLRLNQDGYENAAFGFNALYSNTSGYHNSAFGVSALTGSESGYNNSAFGYYAGNSVSSGSNLTLIGYNAQPSSGTVSNEITFGNGNITTIRSNVQSITSLSDERDKKNIKELNLGIDFLMKIKPRLFNWDKREWYENNESDGSKMQKNPSAGFIAQELDTAQMSENVGWLNLVLKDNPDRVEATFGNLLPIIVKAIQDLKKENDQLKAKNEVAQVVNENLKTSTNELNTRLTKFEKMQSQLIAEIEKLKANNDGTTKVSMGTK